MKEGKELAGLLGYQLQMCQIIASIPAREALMDFDISPARLTALTLIRDNQGCTQTALGDKLHVNRSSAMKLVNYLEARGLVRREAGADLRANALYLTEEGEALAHLMLAALGDADRQVLSALTREEAASLLGLLNKVRQAAEAGQ
ncbi:MAG: MarR family transcriptional regulator [Sphingobium sp.]|nr:MarR family transcriptional regulator [Sphingobium sp.]